MGIETSALLGDGYLSIFAGSLLVFRANSLRWIPARAHFCRKNLNYFCFLKSNESDSSFTGTELIANGQLREKPTVEHSESMEA